MVNNKEIVRFIFSDSKIIRNNKFSNQFLKQILNADVVDFQLGLDNVSDLFRWLNGTWKNGIWEDGTWKDGIWIDGTWKRGIWKNGIWHNGTWENGHWSNGIWEDGIWKHGIWIKGRWIKGKIWDCKKRIYIESDKSPDKCEWSSSYDK